MDLRFSDEDLAFQQKARAFIEENLPADIREKVKGALRLYKDDYVRWHKILAKQGWLVPEWPVEHGGTDWTPVQRHIFLEEQARAYAPRLVAFGIKMVGPVIYTFGSKQQKDHYLPRILSAEDFWCQGYSEPGSGSDLASLQTKAVRKGDHYIVNGSKTWTTMAQYADWMFCLCRTDPSAKFQEGISFLLVDMKQPGVEVKPIRTMDGGREINTVYLTDVKVPVEDRVGEENKGWTYAKFLLSHERSGIARIGASKAQIDKLRQIARHQRCGDGYLIDDEDFKRDVAQVEIDLHALEYTELRALTAAAKGEAPGPEANVLKIRGTELQQKISELLMKAMGYYAMPYVPEALEPGYNEDPIGPESAAPLAAGYFNMRKTSIYGGTNEIQKNIIAKMVLGL
jgi:alkylation response protein AidB-like acyl-CoA dehydrogenase